VNSGVSSKVGPDPFAFAFDLLDPPVAEHFDDPVAWVRDVLGEHLWSKQRDICESVRDNRYTAVPSCHDAGKSFVSSRLIAWWIATRPPGQAFVVSTAPTFAQVRAILWREIGKAHKKGRLAGRVNQTEWHLNGELVGYGRKPADHDQSAFQGIHAKYVLAVIDEACGVPKDLFDAVDTIVTNEHCRVVAIGNPDDPTAHFEKVCRPASGWNVVPIDGYDTPNLSGEDVPEDLKPLLLSKTWVEERKQRWGEDSALYTAKVRGRFPEDAEDSIIPLSWVRRAQRRWADSEAVGKPTRVGVDVARGGADQSAIAIRHGRRIDRIVRLDRDDTTILVGDVIKYAQGAQAVVDVIGVGSGPLDQLKAKGHPVVAFNASQATEKKDRAGELGFVNCRAAAWWGMRELLEHDEIDLPDDDELAAELTAPRWHVTASGKIRVEAKDDIRKRLGRSTDSADAAIQAVWAAPVSRKQSTRMYSLTR
jgi:hypothetical protein